MGSGLSCCRCWESGRGRGFHPLQGKKGNENDSKRIQPEYMTLEDWLSADDCEIQALRRFSINIHESLLNDIDRGGGGGGDREFSSDTHGDGIGEEGKGDLGVISLFERNHSRKGQKRVSFRLPEQRDIIVFDSPGSGCNESDTNKK